MDILHYLNVVIGFSLVMLILSTVVGAATQAFLSSIKLKTRSVSTGLMNLLQEIGLQEEVASRGIGNLLNTTTGVDEGRFWRLLGLAKIFLLIGAPKNIGREDFVFALLKKAANDDILANQLGIDDAENARKLLAQAEQAMLQEEIAGSNLSSSIWKMKALSAVIPDLTAKIFSRFDELMDRIDEGVSVWGKGVSTVVALAFISLFWPIDSINLLSRLSSDKILSENVASLADQYVPALSYSQDLLLKCEKDHPESIKLAGQEMDPCNTQRETKNKLASDKLDTLLNMNGLFGASKVQPCSNSLTDCLIQRISYDELRKNLNSGVLISWILVSLGSAFWLGLLNKLIGLRSELGHKLASEREKRSGEQ